MLFRSEVALRTADDGGAGLRDPVKIAFLVVARFSRIRFPILKRYDDDFSRFGVAPDVGFQLVEIAAMDPG